MCRKCALNHLSFPHILATGVSFSCCVFPAYRSNYLHWFSPYPSTLFRLGYTRDFGVLVVWQAVQSVLDKATKLVREILIRFMIYLLKWANLWFTLVCYFCCFHRYREWRKECMWVIHLLRIFFQLYFHSTLFKLLGINYNFPSFFSLLVDCIAEFSLTAHVFHTLPPNVL
jgi:hypothetical protein